MLFTKLLANEHDLPKLVALCELKLIGLVTSANATLLFKHADTLKIRDLRAASLEIILNEFDNLKKEDLDCLDSNLLAEIYREKTPHPLHLSIRHGRDDVVFIFLLSDAKTKIDQRDEKGQQSSPK